MNAARKLAMLLAADVAGPFLAGRSRVSEPSLVAFEHDRSAALGREIHLRDETFLAELLAMHPHGIARCRHIARVRNLSAAFVAGRGGAGRRAGAYATRQQGQRHAARRKSHGSLDMKNENPGFTGILHPSDRRSVAG